MDPIQRIGSLGKVEGLQPEEIARPAAAASPFADTLKDAIVAVDDLQKQSEAAQLAYTRNENIELHDVLIRIEEAEVAFKTMMEIRNKLVEAYREVMRMGA